jgi:hypothetical protein
MKRPQMPLSAGKGLSSIEVVWQRTRTLMVVFTPAAV